VPSSCDKPESGLLPVLRALRKRGDEAQLTQLITAIAEQDPAFAAGLARTLVALSGRNDVPRVPGRLGCRAEQSLTNAHGSSAGGGDLLFEDADGAFSLLVELKLQSGYGIRQLERYLSSLQTLAGDSSWLIAVTTHMPHYGERQPAGTGNGLGRFGGATRTISSSD
jgi:hypothetical protein